MLKITGYYVDKKQWFLSQGQTMLTETGTHKDKLITAEFRGTSLEIHQLGICLLRAVFRLCWRREEKEIEATITFSDVCITRARTVRIAVDSAGRVHLTGTIYQMEQLGQHLISVATKSLRGRHSRVETVAHIFQSPKYLEVRTQVIRKRK